jgi:NAD+ synthase (glutamine-hydrolysing)
MRVTVAQLNPTVGDVKGNLKKIAGTLRKHAKESDLCVFTELFLSGYPPKDLLEKDSFIAEVEEAVKKLTCLSKKYPSTGILVGAPTKAEGGLYNTAILIEGGRVLGSQHKFLLPAYDVFDEARYFKPASASKVMPFKGEVLGVSVCEDAWSSHPLESGRVYSFDPVAELARRRATLLVNISASPFCAGKEEARYSIIRRHARKHKLPFIYVNQVGGNDELVFDGRSMCVDREGNAFAVLRAFEEEVATVDTSSKGRRGAYVPQERIASVHDALVLGVRDYMRKCGFEKAVVGLSGGVDSAVTCCLAVEAVGNENVLGVSMPSQYSSKGSIEDARKLAGNLGIEFKVIPINSIYGAYVESLRKHLNTGKKIDLSLENIQARIRGNILMALSNRFGHLLLSTGNKSELAVGYCTLYGDMSGGLAVISDVPKTMVYRLASYINRKAEVIPASTIRKPPSAELKPNQCDQDTLPPYGVLDEVLCRYIEDGLPAKDIVKLGFDRGTVSWVIQAVNRSEYKRRQAPPGLKVTSKAFGFGRRMPIAAKYEVT